LANLVIETGRTYLLDIDGVCALENLDLVARDLAEDSNGETRPGKWVSADEVCRDVEQPAEYADLICVYFWGGPT
jgi:hypothetical protein